MYYNSSLSVKGAILFWFRICQHVIKQNLGSTCSIVVIIRAKVNSFIIIVTKKIGDIGISVLWNFDLFYSFLNHVHSAVVLNVVWHTYEMFLFMYLFHCKVTVQKVIVNGDNLRIFLLPDKTKQLRHKHWFSYSFYLNLFYL